MTMRNFVLGLSVAVLSIACSRQDTAEEAVEQATDVPAEATPDKGIPAAGSESAENASATQPGATDMMPAAASAPAAAAGATSPAAAPPESNAEDQATQAGADTDAPAAAPGSHDTVIEHAATTVSTTATHAAMASHVHQPATTDASASARAERVQRFAALAARAVFPALLSKEDSSREPPQTYSLKLGDVGISNLDPGVGVHFALKTQDAEWHNQSLEPDATEEFGCGGLLYSDCLFWMRTGTKPPTFYKMHTPGRYVIFWDGNAARWDLRIAGSSAQ